VDDLRKLEDDEGFCRVLRRIERKGMTRRERRELDRQWRKERSRGVPSPSTVFRFLSGFHDATQEAKRVAGTAKRDALYSFCIPAVEYMVGGAVVGIAYGVS